MLTIDGAQGEGGGQILRTALALSLCLGRPFRIINIRANRRRPGLQNQHLAAVNAAATISHARLYGAARDSMRLQFEPGRVIAGNYRFDIGSAGSTNLVLQTVLPALLLAPQGSTIALLGGTHNPLAPPFEFMQHAFIPLVKRMGATMTLVLQRPGFAPQGGGLIQARIKPSERLQRLELVERGRVAKIRAEVMLANLPRHIAERELAVIASRLTVEPSQHQVRADDNAAGPGNTVSVIIESEHITECFSAFGKRGVPAERVAGIAVKAAQEYLDADVPVGRHLADQLLVLLTLAGGGGFVTMQPSLHTLTNITVIESFIAGKINCEQLSPNGWKISLSNTLTGGC